MSIKYTGKRCFFFFSIAYFIISLLLISLILVLRFNSSSKKKKEKKTQIRQFNKENITNLIQFYLIRKFNAGICAEL